MDKPPHEFWNPRTSDDAKVCVARLKMAQGLLIAAANADPYLIGCGHWQRAMEGVNAVLKERVNK